MSLRARMLVGMALIAVVLVGAAVTISRATEANLVRQVDDQLQRAATRTGDGDHGGFGRPGRDPGADDYVAPTGPSTLYVLVATSTRVEAVSTPGLTKDATAPVPDITTSQVKDLAAGGYATVGSKSSKLRYRVMVQPTQTSGSYLVYALPLEDVDATIAHLVTVETVASLSILAVLGLVTFWVLRLGVRPVKQMTATAAAIGQGDLSRRIPESAPGTEAGELGVALNSMLGRIEESFDERARSEARLRQFVADASHELRTPVTTIRGYAELYRVGGLAREQDLSEAMRRTEQEAIRMGALVQDLLDLARLDQGRPLALEPVDLSVLVADAALDAHAVEPDRPVDVNAPNPVVIVGDEAMLRQIVANLVANARVHTAPDTAFHLGTRIEDGRAVLEVSDDGPGMSPEVAARAFERFYRADPARARQTGGSGLGLSIVAATAAAHGGDAALQTAPGHGTTVRLTLPLVPPTAAEPPRSGDGETV